VLLNLLLEPPRRHVLDHTLPQQADGFVGHRKLLSRMGLNPTIMGQAAYSRSPEPLLPRERFSPMAPSRRTAVFLSGRYLPLGASAPRGPAPQIDRNR
ncbi:hypothetical protein, partial [Rhodoblastus sp.]|uniref:hypothetical protein n=1 Tax=Rhodoblastus sp. TaxID=1962975 RepID=UPI003F9BF95B